MNNSKKLIKYLDRDGIRYFTKLICAMIAFSFLLSCAAERTVQNNHFYSSSPKMHIKVDSGFSYLGNMSLKDKLYEMYTESNVVAGNSNTTHYVFAILKQDAKVIEKAIIIMIENTWSPSHHMSMPLIDKRWKSVSNYSLVAVGDDRYESAVSNRIGLFDYAFEKWLHKKGYQLPECKLNRMMISLEDDNKLDQDNTSKKYLIKKILYFEDVTSLKIDCKQWSDMKKLSAHQEKFIEEFVVRSNKSFNIISD